MTCLDNNALAYATEPQADPKFIDLQKRVKHYIASLRDEGTKVIIPTAIR